MGFLYNPLWKQLIDKKMNKEQLRKGINTSPATIAKMGKDEFVSMKVLDDICTFLNCTIDQVIEHTKE